MTRTKGSSIALEPTGWPASEERLPSLPRTFLPRPRLWERLEAGAAGAATLVVAPAGAGKTLGVVGWLHHSGRAEGTIWLTASSHLDVATIGKLIAECRAPAAGGDDSRLLVIDDAHRLTAPTVSFLDEEINQRPDRLRLLLLSRWDLPLARLGPELLGHLSVIRGNVLKLEDGEAARLVAAHAHTDSSEVVDAILERTEGWCAAAVLAAKAVAAAPDPVDAASRYRQGGLSVVDRVANEVFVALRPRERHLLLSVTGEEAVSPATAAHLTRDSRAGEILAELEMTGLLVTSQPEPPAGPTTDGQGEYRIHPLLVEVARRRLSAGGVDVAQAKSTVRRAARLDVVNGEPRQAFDRLVAIEEPEEAATLLASEGVTLVLRGAGGRLHAFARRHRAVVEVHPECWFALALDRWYAGDTTTATRWFGRILDRDLDGVEQACVRLMRSGLGQEPVRRAVTTARAVVSRERSRVSAHSLLPLVELELGAAETWLGDLADAQTDLSAVLMASRVHDLPLLTGEALTHMAVTQYLMGRESACLALADDARKLGSDHAWLPSITIDRATIVSEMAHRRRLPWPDSPLGPDRELPKVHDGDPTTKYLARCLHADRLMAGGLVVEAENTVDVPLEVPDLPDHLRVRGLVDRAAQAVLASDRETLQDIADRLSELGARGEAALASGLRADLGGDQRRAAGLFAEAARNALHTQPPTAATALVCQAQLLDSARHTDEAMVALQAAVTATEARRNATPFLGWVRQGTPVSTLLTRLQKRLPSEWGAQLAEATTAHPGLAAFFGAVTATPQERARVPEQMIAPTISPREREVLYELARGSTYADIAANLFVSENTVKTHVSSLYAKLAVRRRSEALAIARTLHLI